jgi:uncharacterized protein with HEPN domain
VSGRGRGDRARLSDIAGAIDDLEAIAAGGRRTFERSRRDQLAARAALEILGEAARQLSPELRAAHPVIDWEELMAFRNRAIHEYFQVSSSELWEIATRKLPALRERLRQVRA